MLQLYRGFTVTLLRNTFGSFGLFFASSLTKVGRRRRQNRREGNGEKIGVQWSGEAKIMKHRRTAETKMQKHVWIVWTLIRFVAHQSRRKERRERGLEGERGGERPEEFSKLARSASQPENLHGECPDCLIQFFDLCGMVLPLCLSVFLSRSTSFGCRTTTPPH